MTYVAYERWKSVPQTNPPHLSVIIPAYNESERILPTIGAIASHVSSLGFPWELIVADDGSTDGTPELVESLGFANLRLLRAKRNGGKGSAVRRGMLAARGRYLLFTDADNSTPIEEVGKLLRKVEAGYPVAVGSRSAEGAEEAHKSLWRRILSGGLRWIVRYGLSIGVRDTQCGFKLYRRDVGQRLHRAQTVMGFSFDLEILYLAHKWGFRVAEVAVDWVDSPGSKVEASKEIRRFLRDMAVIRLNDVKGLYGNV